MEKRILLTNVADSDIMREVQLQTMKMISEYLLPSYGPKGSTTAIMKSDESIQYSKDGHTILKNIIFQNPIETALKNNIEDITRNIVNTVGDGTTSAVILSQLIFESLNEFMVNNTDMLPSDIVSILNEIVEDIKKIILSNARDLTPDDAYNISLISTNNNTVIANTIKDIYTKFGNDVFIDVSTSPNENTMIKEYDGLTLDTGYDETCFVNTSQGTSRIKNPKIFMFVDPIDTYEMGALLDSIIHKYVYNTDTAHPVVIIAPKISRDFSSLITKLSDQLFKITDPKDRPPVLLIANSSGIFDMEKLEDLRLLTGATFIRKYINADIMKIDIENGDAPTPETIDEFCGMAELVEADTMRTKFVNPQNMLNDDGSYSDEYNNLINYLEKELINVEENEKDLSVIHLIKKRIQSLKASMVEYLVGGMTTSDRDATKDLVEDAVLNCRSAAKHGYGRASSIEGLHATYELKHKYKDEVKIKIINILYDAYHELYTNKLLKNNTTLNINSIEEIVNSILKNDSTNKLGFDIRSMHYSTNIISSIYSDIAVIEAINTLVTLVVTTNQFIVPDIMYNRYLNKDKL